MLMLMKNDENMSLKSENTVKLQILTQDLDYFHELIFVDELARLGQSHTT